NGMADRSRQPDSSILVDRWRIYPDDARHPRTRVSVAMTKNRAKEERILCTGEIGTATDGQLELAFQYQAEFLALMLDGVLTTTLWLDDVDIGLEKHPFAERHQSLVLNTFASAEGIEIQDRPTAGSRNDVAARGRSREKACEIDFEGLSDALE